MQRWTTVVLLAGTALLASRPARAWQAPPQFGADTVRRRAIEHSDAFYTRLTIHRIGSYTILPLFAGEYLLGQQLLNGNTPADWVRGTHRTVAFAIASVFAVNTVTGIWNLVEARKDPNATRRWLHVGLMLASDAGFVYTGTLAGGERRFSTSNRALQHRNAAIASMSLSVAGTLLMWLWKGD